VGILEGYTKQILLAGGTQMLAVAAVRKELGRPIPSVVTTVYVRDDPSANFASCAAAIGAPSYYVDPAFGDLGHAGLARYCIGEVKEGMGAGGAMMLAHMLGYTSDQIREAIFAFIRGYS
jgi:NaMN:DMB phosphoribosyltransferase